jgi:hypothetical protein
VTTVIDPDPTARRLATLTWRRTDLGYYVSGGYELIPVGFRRRREGYVIQHDGAHVDSCSTLARAKARAERHRATSSR